MADETTDPEVTEPEGATPDEPLGEPGKKALETERTARKQAEDKARTLAAQLKEIEDRDKTEAEKAAERLAEAEKRASEVEARATRAEVAAATGLPVDLLAGPKSGSEEDVQGFADLLAAHIAEASKKAPNGPVIPSQGKKPTTEATESADDWFRHLARS